MPQTDPDVQTLTAYFFLLYFLMATQDIAVDGWAITMLTKENRGYGAACNSIGQSLGFFLANQGLLAFSDETWCRRYLGFENGKILVSLPDFMIFWGAVFIVVTMCVWIFKKELPLGPDDEEPPGLVQTYKEVIAICKLKNVQYLCLILLTCKAAFSPADSVFTFKLQEYGLPKADIATFSPLLLIVGLFLPALISSRVSANPLDIFMYGVPLKLLTTSLSWLVFQVLAHFKSTGVAPNVPFYIFMVTIMVFHEVAGVLVFISMMTFFSKISDPLMGGTYMTLLNTVANLGHKWPNSLILWLLPKLTQSECIVQSTGLTLYANCLNEKSQCSSKGGVCSTTVDGYTIQTGTCIVLGLIWLLVSRNTVRHLQSRRQDEWSSTKSAKAKA